MICKATCQLSIQTSIKKITKTCLTKPNDSLQIWLWPVDWFSTTLKTKRLRVFLSLYRIYIYSIDEKYVSTTDYSSSLKSGNTTLGYTTTNDRNVFNNLLSSPAQPPRHQHPPPLFITHRCMHKYVNTLTYTHAHSYDMAANCHFAAILYILQGHGCIYDVLTATWPDLHWVESPS